MTTTSTSTHDSDCTACAEGERFMTMSRRGFFALAGAAGLVTATTIGGARVGLLDGLTPAASAATATDTDCLVVLSLRGGCDGLNIVVPAGSPEYYSRRPNIAIPQGQLKRVNDTFGLAPALEPLYPLWDAGTFGAVHAVGMERPNRSHFEAMDEMERASTTNSLYSGWIDRSVGALGGVDSPFAAVAMGTDNVPISLSGPEPEFAMRNINGVQLAVNGNDASFDAIRQAMAELHAGTDPIVSGPTLRGIGAVASAQGLPAGGDNYPNGGLSNALKDVARLVKDPTSGIRFATVDFGGWDMHEGMGGPREGRMFSKVNEMAQALRAFADDLGPDLNRVTLITLSEFGRPAHQNGSSGTDHGYGNCVLMLGGGVNGGRVHGRWPGLADDQLVQRDLAVTTDYRVLIAEILASRCGIADVASVFPGLPTSDRLGVVRAR